MMSSPFTDPRIPRRSKKGSPFLVPLRLETIVAPLRNPSLRTALPVQEPLQRCAVFRRSINLTLVEVYCFFCSYFPSSPSVIDKKKKKKKSGPGTQVLLCAACLYSRFVRIKILLSCMEECGKLCWRKGRSPGAGNWGIALDAEMLVLRFVPVWNGKGR